MYSLLLYCKAFECQISLIASSPLSRTVQTNKVQTSKAAKLQGREDGDMVEYKVVLKDRVKQLSHNKQSNYMYQKNVQTGFEVSG